MHAKTPPLLPMLVLAVMGSCLHNGGAYARTLDVGTGQTYPLLRNAAEIARPGDTLLLHSGNHTPDQFIANLKGTPTAWIVIRGQGDHAAVFRGGGQAFLMTDPAYVRFENFTVEAQTLNGIHINDDDSYDTPAHHLKFESCWFRDMAGTGNCDYIKISGADTFEVVNCRFTNGAHGGGSGIDMVGCHWGTIRNNEFVNNGNPIQTKGGSRFIRIESNLFKDVDMRTINMGGSTDMPAFRPINATYEAADILVYSNIFVNCMAPVCFAGSVNCKVVNNTIYNPQKYVIRILQETVDPSRFVPCSKGVFRNNIIAVGNAVTTECNIGLDTDPKSFVFSNNLWWAIPGSSWTRPRDIPVADSASKIGSDPLFANAVAGNFSLPKTSPARSMGYPATEPVYDYRGVPFGSPRSTGAYEATGVGIRFSVLSGKGDGIVVSKSGSDISVKYAKGTGGFQARIIGVDGRVTVQAGTKGTQLLLPMSQVHCGTWLLEVDGPEGRITARLVVFE